MKNTAISKAASALLIAILLIAQTVGAVTSSYYSTINNTSGSTLRDKLYTITSVGPQNMSYDKLWTAYKTTDVYPKGHPQAGKIWDMYSDCSFTAGGSGKGGQCGTYNDECDCYNREHSMPKSWFNESKPAYYDLGHIVPTDGKVNGVRSNYAFGEVSSSTYTFKHSASKFGNAKSVTTTNVKGDKSITTSYTGKVYEPDDQYKGDFARMYMYMRVRYKSMNITTGDGSLMFNSTDANLGMTDYSIALLMKWHRQDPVSQKEIDRNNGMESVQGNRNPFIDYPSLAEYLWGKLAGETFVQADNLGSFEAGFEPGESDGLNNNDPAMISPSGIINMGTTAAGTPIADNITVHARNLTNGNLTLSLSGANASLFSLSKTSISDEQAEAGYNILITYSPTANGNHTATLTINGCGISNHQVTIEGSCEVRYVVTWMADGEEYNTNTAAQGESPALPSAPDDCSEERVFVGWTAQSSVSSEPADLFTEQAPAATSNTTFYAVYADKQESAGSGSGDYEKVTTTPANWAGDYLIVYNNARAFNGGLETLDAASNYIAVSVTDNKIASNSTTDAAKFTMAEVTGGYSIRSASGYYIGRTSNSNGLEASTSTVYANTLSINSSGDFVCVSGEAYLRYNANDGQDRFRYFKSSSYTSQKAINLFRKTSGSATTYSNYSLLCTAGAAVTITYHANGGTGEMEQQHVIANKHVTLSTNAFTREGYAFLGWTTTADGEIVYDDEETVNIDADMDLYAKWMALPTYTVTFMNNGAEYAVRSGIAGQTMDAVADPTACDGYTFEGWSTNQYAADNTATPLLDDIPTTIPAADVTYYAVYSHTQSSGGGSGEFAFVPADFSGQGTSGTGSPMSATKNGVTLSFDYGYGATQIRSYSGGTFTFSADYAISAITITTNNYKGNAENIALTSGGGSYTGSGTTGTWTGSSTEVTFANAAKQVQITAISGTVGGGSSVTYHTTAPCTTPTPTEEVNEAMQVRKFIRDGRIIILRNNTEYGIDGKQL